MRCEFSQCCEWYDPESEYCSHEIFVRSYYGTGRPVGCYRDKMAEVNQQRLGEISIQKDR